MYQWIENGLVSVVHIASGAPLICYSSLFAPSDEELREYLQENRQRVEKTVRKREVSWSLGN